MSTRSLKGLCAWLLGLAVIGPVPSASAVALIRAPVHCPGSGLLPTASNLERIETATLCLVDVRRGSRGRQLLRANPDLSHIADGQVHRMVRFDYFADIGPAGQTPLSLVSASRYPRRYTGFAVGQNLAWGSGNASSPARIVAAWMADPPHRAIMLDGRYRDAGVGTTAKLPAVIGQGQWGATYAIEFGVRRR